MDRLDSWLNSQAGWRGAVLIWLLLCPVAVAAGSVYCAWVTLSIPRLDPGLLGLAIGVALLAAVPVAGLLDVVARRWRARGGRGLVLSWRVYAALPCVMSGPVLLPGREAIEAHLTVVFAALAVSRYLQNQSGVSIKKLVQTLRTARSATIDVNGQHLTLDPELTPAARALLRKLQQGH